IAGSHTVNGVAELHSKILKERIFHDFVELWPDRFTSVTNGVTQRRWMLHANPGLSGLITNRIGGAWATDLPRLRELEAHADDAAFRERWRAVKAANKARLARPVHELTEVEIDPAMNFHVQGKRLAQDERQPLNALPLAD